MFTGIVTHRGRLHQAADTTGQGRRFVLRPEPDMQDVALGDSIAVDGVCLTVSGFVD
ncbi:MAG: riboflavin synthase, partial [Planctomycetota bacterium]